MVSTNLIIDGKLVKKKNTTEVRSIETAHKLLWQTFYVTETNTYRAFLPFNTPIRKIGFCPDRSGQNPIFRMGVLKGKNAR